MHSLRHIHWVAPLVILSSLLSGVLLAVAHHLFYLTLAGTSVHDQPYQIIGLKVSQQQFNSAVGTALSFLGRTCLIVALSTAYLQMSWLETRRRKGGNTVSALDTMHAALGNVWLLFRLDVWWKRPMLFFVALISWLVPIASVMTPATLSVVVAPVLPVPSQLVDIPQPGFQSVKFLAPPVSHSFFDGPIRAEDWLVYRGPSPEVERITLATAVTGAIATILPPTGQNNTWSLDFYGPSLKCTDIDVDLRNQMRVNIIQAWSNGTACQSPFRFMAWTAAQGFAAAGTLNNQSINGEDNSFLPLRPSSPGYPYTMHTGTLGPLDYYAIGRNGTKNATNVATIYMAVMPQSTYLEPGECPTSPNTPQAQAMFGNSSMIQCQLHNTSYHANFNYTNGQQNITFQSEQNEAVETIAGFYMPLQSSNNCTSLNDISKECFIDPAILERLSYQAMMDAFGSVFVGNIQVSKGGSTYSLSTNVMSTVLLNTAEFAPLRPPSNWADSTIDLFNVTSAMSSLYDWVPSPSDAMLKPTLEQLFQNTVLSMFSSLHLRPNASSAFAPAKVEVVSNDLHNVYAYSPANLWLANGLAIGFVLLGVLFGFVAMLRSAASFSGDFSTILRAARTARLSAAIRPEDGGEAPLPKQLRNATVMFAHDEKSVTLASARATGSMESTETSYRSKGRYKVVVGSADGHGGGGNWI